MNPTPALFRLQQIDSQLDTAQRRINEINQLIENDELVLAARQAHTSSQEQLAVAQGRLRVAEDKRTDTRIKREQSEASLYSGTIRNPKELQDLQKEIASLNNRISTLEEEQLEIMLEVDSLQEQFDDTRKALEVATGQAVSRNSLLSGERATLEKTCLRLNTEKEAAASAIPEVHRATYARLRETKLGLAVSSIEDNACSACGTQVRPAETQIIRAAPDMRFCKFCGRILYAS